MGRLLGTETEYAIRFRPAEGVSHPGNEVVFQAIRAAVERRVLVRPGQGPFEAARHRVFTENGGSLYYEFVAEHPDGGLVEAGTPECVAPRQLLVYQRAQDRLLSEAVREAQDQLRDRGLAGEVALLKNCRDAQGHVYGAQESYEVEIARGPWLLAWRLAMVVAVASAVVVTAVQWAVWLTALLVVGSAFLATGVVLVLLLLVTRLPTSAADGFVRAASRAADALDRLETAYLTASFAPTIAWCALAVRLFAFRAYHRGATAFLASRSIVTGAGTLFQDDGYGLSEKAPSVKRLWRWTVQADDRGLYEIGHLCKPLLELSAASRWFGIPRLFRRRQRLQIGLSDANLCEVAEYLKVATTSLVLDLAEAGRLKDAPRLADPVLAAQAIAADPSLRAWVPLQHSGNLTALEIQRWYLDRAKEWVDGLAVPDLEARKVVALWGEVLDALEHHPESLFGKVDWVTKLHLVSQAPDLPWASRKKIDLRYHELGTGYFAWLEEAGATTRLVEPGDLVAAARTPPAGSPAEERGRRIKEEAENDADLGVEWDRGRDAPPPTTGAVIDFAAAARRRRAAPPPEP